MFGKKNTKYSWTNPHKLTFRADCRHDYLELSDEWNLVTSELKRNIRTRTRRIAHVKGLEEFISVFKKSSILIDNLPSKHLWADQSKDMANLQIELKFILLGFAEENYTRDPRALQFLLCACSTKYQSLWETQEFQEL